MRVGLDISKALSRDGIGTYSLELLRALRGLDADLELELFDLLEPVDARSLRQRLGGLPERFRPSFGRPPDPGRLDLFHATAWAYPPGFPRPLVLTCHDLTVFSHPDCHTLANKVLCATGLVRAHLDGATFLAVSRATADELERWLGVAGDRIGVVHSAPAAHFRPLPEDAARGRVEARFGLTGAPVLAVGTLEPRKNLERLTRAWSALPEELRRAHPLVVAGGAGWKSDATIASAATLVGRVDAADLAALYGAAAVFAYPSLAEGFGLPILEAMACGAPVVTSGTGAMAEVAGSAARLVDPLDVDDIRRALEELLRDAGERRRLRDLGRRRAREFSWEKAARETFELYTRAMKG